MEPTTKTPNLSELFYERFRALTRHEMSKDVAELFIMTMHAKQNGRADEMFEESKKMHHIFPMVEKYFEAHGVKTDAATKFFLATICETPANVNMYVSYLGMWAEKENTAMEVTFEDFSQQVFPNGFPSMIDLSALWDAMKAEKERERIKNMPPAPVKASRKPDLTKRMKSGRKRGQHYAKLGTKITYSRKPVDNQ